MGLRIQRRINLGGGAGINVSKSGLGFSYRTPFGTIGSKGYSIRTGIPGVTYRGSSKGSDLAGFSLALAAGIVLAIAVTFVVGIVIFIGIASYQSIRTRITSARFKKDLATGKLTELYEAPKSITRHAPSAAHSDTSIIAESEVSPMERIPYTLPQIELLPENCTPFSGERSLRLRDMLEGEAWRKSNAILPIALGRDEFGNDFVVDLVDFTHLLIGGTTGSGKTAFLNSMLLGLLMCHTPDELRLLLVDTKGIELGCYNDIPHLVVPVITDPKKVAISLRWAITEMENRFKLFAKAGVRNIEGYSNLVMCERNHDTNTNECRTEIHDIPIVSLPRIAIVVDELAELIKLDNGSFETSIEQLARGGRAVGIHMILSTQRPSADVITGTIKACIPARIAFKVVQSSDSRTILETNGAEKLRGSGEMLFQPQLSLGPKRLQGTFCEDREIQAVTEFVRAQFLNRLTPPPESSSVPAVKAVVKNDTFEDEDMIQRSIEIIRKTHRASTSSLQRRLRVGYSRAAGILDVLEERGIVGPPRGEEPREILLEVDIDLAKIEDDISEETRDAPCTHQKSATSKGSAEDDLLSVFLMINNEKVGPVHENKLQYLLETNQISEATPIWYAGMSDWMPLKEMLESTY
jgi:hypothetical protein